MYFQLLFNLINDKFGMMYSSSDIGLEEEDDELPTSVASANNSQNQSRRTRTFKVDNHFDGR